MRLSHQTNQADVRAEAAEVLGIGILPEENIDQDSTEKPPIEKNDPPKKSKETAENEHRPPQFAPLSVAGTALNNIDR